MIHSNLKPCCYKCDTPLIETERIEHRPHDISYFIYCEHACVCKHYTGDTSNDMEATKKMTKYEIAERIRALLDLDIDDLIDATLDLVQEIELEAEDEY